jgi:hypothetical protein
MRGLAALVEALSLWFDAANNWRAMIEAADQRVLLSLSWL